MAHLSSLQQILLKWLLGEVQFAEQNDPRLLENGFPWRINVTDKARENALRASICRSLARLENRGLITRLRGPKDLRTVRVVLTPLGRSVAETIDARN